MSGLVIAVMPFEVAPAQHEIDFRYGEALTTADNIMTFKLAVKTIAKRHGLHATFMPKPKYGVNGSGMHINMSLSKDGRNIFADEKDKFGLSKEAYYFIGGIMKHMKGMTAITNPLINSYKRLVPEIDFMLCRCHLMMRCLNDESHFFQRQNHIAPCIFSKIHRPQIEITSLFMSNGGRHTIFIRVKKEKFALLEKALDNECMFDGSSIEGFARIEESDMYLNPDYNTFEIFPWRPQQGKVACLMSCHK